MQHLSCYSMSQTKVQLLHVEPVHQTSFNLPSYIVGVFQWLEHLISSDGYCIMGLINIPIWMFLSTVGI